MLPVQSILYHNYLIYNYSCAVSLHRFKIYFFFKNSCHLKKKQKKTLFWLHPFSLFIFYMARRSVANKYLLYVLDACMLCIVFAMLVNVFLLFSIDIRIDLCLCMINLRTYILQLYNLVNIIQVIAYSIVKFQSQQKLSYLLLLAAKHNYIIGSKNTKFALDFNVHTPPSS